MWYHTDAILGHQNKKEENTSEALEILKKNSGNKFKEDQTAEQKRTLIEILKTRKWQVIGHTMRHGEA